MTVLDLIAIDQEGRVYLRYRTTETRGKTVISDAFHRILLEPGDDASALPANVRAICAIEHTQERIDAARARRAAAPGQN